MTLAAQGAGVAGSGPAGGQLAPPVSNTPPEKRCVLAGHVTNALTGEPVKKANLSLTVSRPGESGTAMMWVNGAPNQQGYSASSENDGTFRIEGIEPGQYKLSGNKSGFIHSSYGAKRPNQPGTTLTLNPGQQLTDVTLSLTPQAVVTGKVTDEDGDPITGGMIQVIKQTWMRGKLRYMPANGGQINDLGEYRIANLSPGKYYLSAQQFPKSYAGMQELPLAPGKPDIRPVRTYYPGTTALPGATPIEIKAGQDMTGMDIRMQSAQTYHIRGKVVGNIPEGSTEHASINVSRRDEQSFAFFGGASNIKPDGSFDMPGIAPGSYTLNYFIMSGRIRSAGHQDVDVGAGDVNGVVLALQTPGSMRGVVKLEGTPQANASTVDVANIHISLSPSDFARMMGPPPNAKVAKDGSFTLDNISPGKYFVQANAPKGTYLKSIRYGASEVLGKELDLSGGAGGEIEVVYRYGPGEVDGTIQQAQNGTNTTPSAPSAQILLVPDVLNADGSGVRFGNTNSDGSFSMTGVPPGHYRAYALEAIDSEQTQNPDVLKQLEQKGMDVEVKENDRRQIQLPFI
ncbi:MAG: carboxypeptidase regulatory-like domain-containing protein, partial [Acidobacteriaceae bacterium]|nr:carboxypeptidase regulatory-like domain-containing protein [Acidobacteriaceae bacterium]